MTEVAVAFTETAWAECLCKVTNDGTIAVDATVVAAPTRTTYLIRGVTEGSADVEIRLRKTQPNDGDVVAVITADGTQEPHLVRVIGRHLRFRPSPKTSYDTSIFDRQVRALGAEGQRLLRALHVGVVGAGGHGSAVFELLCRVGIGSITVIDDDVITPTNVTRVFGSSIDDVGKPKVEVAAANAERIGLGTKVTPLRGSVNDEAVAQQLRGCDLIFGCTDDNLGRAALSRLAYHYLVPFFDLGVKVDSERGSMRDVFGRLTIVGPSTACLRCRNRLDLQRLQSEALPENERRQRIAEGYAPELGDPDPSVVPYTSAVAALAVSEMLARVMGFKESDPLGEYLIRFLQPRIGTNVKEGHERCYCTNADILGVGDTDPFLGMTWTA